MRCKACNAEIVDGAKFCMMCGAKVQREIFCGQCGTKQPEGARFCFNCGAALTIQQPSASKGQVKKKSNEKVLDEYTFAREYYRDGEEDGKYAYGGTVIYMLDGNKGTLTVMDIEKKSVIDEITFKDWESWMCSEITASSKGLILADSLMRATKVALVSWEQIKSREISIGESKVYSVDKNYDVEGTSICGEALYVLKKNKNYTTWTVQDATDCVLEKINLVTGEKCVIWNMADLLEEFYSALLEQKGRKGDVNLKSQMLEDISNACSSSAEYGYVGKKRAVVKYSIRAEGRKFLGGLERIVSIDLNSLKQTVLCDLKERKDVKIAKFDMKNDVMWLQKTEVNGWGDDKLYKHKIQPLKNIADITRCIESWTLPNGCGIDRSNMDRVYFDGKRMYYHEGHKFVCGDNNGKYSVWSYEKYGNEKYGYFNIDLYSYYSIIGSWLHFTNCDIDIYVDEDAVDVFIPNEVELAEKDKWLIIRK